MKRFTALFAALDETTRTGEKTAALVRYFREAPPADAAWALHFLMGRKLKRAISGNALRAAVAAASGHPLWLVEECYDAVGDLAETAALLLPGPADPAALLDTPLHALVEERLVPLPGLDDAGRARLLADTWALMDAPARLVWNKLITGGFRVGASKTLLVRAVAEVAGIPSPRPTRVSPTTRSWRWTPSSAARPRNASAPCAR